MRWYNMGSFRRWFYMAALAVLAILWINTMKFIVTLFAENTIVIIQPGRISLNGKNDMMTRSFESKSAGWKSSVTDSTGPVILPSWRVNLEQKSRDALVAGGWNISNGMTKMAKLVIGIASVYREENYLNQTLNSLIEQSESERKLRNSTVVVIYLADSFEEKNKQQLRFIQTHFSAYLASGFFQVIQSSPEIYPSFDFVLNKRTFNDPFDRVVWRTKQVIDYIFLFTYAQELSDYYLVLEDDLVAANKYLGEIMNYTSNKEGKRWTALQFTGFLGIGLLFHSAELAQLIEFLCMFHQNQPVDMLMRAYVELNVPDPDLRVRHIPSLFQHIGTKSSLENKVQKLKDIYFVTPHINPQADIVTTMKAHRNYIPEHAYLRDKPNMFFWGIVEKNKPNTFDIIFKNPLTKLKRFVINTGTKTPVKSGKNGKKKDVLKDTIVNGTIEIGNKFLGLIDNNVASCDNFRQVLIFSEKVDMRIVKQNFTNVQCIRLKINPKLQKSWVAIKEIKIYT